MELNSKSNSMSIVRRILVAMMFVLAIPAFGFAQKIVGTVTDEAGNTVDYLVDSNTVGQRSFPAGAYDYFQQMLIRIYGWNE